MRGNAADDAAHLFIHYFRMIAQKAGIEWDPDYSAEIRTAIDYLMGAVRDIVSEEIRDHAENAPHIYANGSIS